ncbi:DUF3187 family protein [Pontiella sp.]|uniref:DUF3187 family protein n=1 Tax=Pontiella sp. TaxID=2837462 RepID=UPI00356996D5
MRVFTSLLVLLATARICAAAVQQAPVYVANQNPFVQIYGLPKAEAGFCLPRGGWDVAFLYYVSNNAFSDDTGSGETMVWDGETAQYTLKVRYGLFDRLELGVDVPFVQHSGGYLDSMIREFHTFFGFPNDRQDEFEKNRINYDVNSNGTTYRMSEPHSGPGDIRFTAGLPLLQASASSRRSLALRSVLKLPTGDSDYLLGSGSTDLAVGLAYSDYELLDSINTALTLNLGVLYMGDGDVLRDIQKHAAGYGGLSAGWLVFQWLELKLQLDVHTAMYDSDLVQLGSSVQLLAGGTVHGPGDVVVDFGISEQVITDATPDVGFYLMIAHAL